MADILGFKIYDDDKENFIQKILHKLKLEEKVYILSGNPEVLSNALKNEELFNFSKECEIIPDGIGVLLAGILTGQKFKQKIAGIEIFQELLKHSKCENIGIYLLGAEKWVVEMAARKCKEKYNAAIKGYHDGFFDINNCNVLLEEINNSGASALFVAMGSPRQEVFISKYKDLLNCKLFMGVGGSFDVISGKINRAPDWMIALGLEWLYRVIKEPARIKRLAAIPEFILKVLYEKYSIK